MAVRNKNPRAGRLRIVAGKWRSRLLDIADVPGLRPTSERVRETVFNWLAPEIHGAKCLDLCAGTGALGIEALSRGAESVVFVEQSSIAAKVLLANIATLNATGAEVLNTDASSYLRAAKATAFDVVFLDPPFAADILDELCRLLAKESLLANSARVYLEMGRDQPQPNLPPEWQVKKNKTAGNVRYMLVTT